MPKISVLIPAYNVEATLRECLDSVCSQTLDDIEIICVNDGSTDASGTILAEYAEKDKRILLLDKKKNEGLLMARVDAARRATAPYVCILDSDDTIEPDMCETMCRLAQENPDADILHYPVSKEDWSDRSNPEPFDDESAISPKVKRLEGDEIISAIMVDNTVSRHLLGKVFKRELYLYACSCVPEGMYCYVGEGVLLYFFICLKAKVYCGFPELHPLYHYRYGLGITRPGILTMEQFEKYCRCDEFARFMYAASQQPDCPQALREGAEARILNRVRVVINKIRNSLRGTDRLEGMKMLLEVWGDFPGDILAKALVQDTVAVRTQSRKKAGRIRELEQELTELKGGTD